MSAQQKLAYVSLWARQDMDETSALIATGKLNPVDKSVAPFNVSLFRGDRGGKSTLRLSRLDNRNNWVTYGTLVVEQKVKGNMVAYATGQFNGDDVVVFLFDNSEKQQVNSKAPDYTGTMYFDEKKESRASVTNTLVRDCW